MSEQPIGDHALLSDCHGTALVDRRGSIEWLCVPALDSPAACARLLDDEAGHFAISPVLEADVSRTYLDATLVLVTTFATATGTVELTDALAMARGVRGHDLGADSPHVLLRRAVCTDGEVELRMEFAPRFEYGLTVPLLHEQHGALTARGGPAALRLSTGVGLDHDGERAQGVITLRAGETRGFALQHTPSWQPPPPAWTAGDVAAGLEDTVEAWRTWSAQHQGYEGPYQALVDHSGRVLQGLTYHPTGAMVAAPTTSLPETVGGERNWDYRYAWVRDASFTLDAQWVAACPDEAGKFLDYLTTAASSICHTRQLQIMFGIRGERDLTERELAHLSGWRNSRPVRVGNGAWAQPQLDVYGELLDAVHCLRGQLGEFDDHERRFLVALADTAAAVWQQTDQGIWEVRGPPRHYLYSKLMCWVALDRAIDLATDLHAGDRVEAWSATRAAIRDAILTRGWDPQMRAFTQSFDGSALDASCLTIPLTGFLPANDERMVATIEAIETHLTDDQGLVYRYRGGDGLAGEEGTFLLCTFWLAQALARAGQPDRARQVFDRAAGYLNDVGLLSEEVDPATGELIGNFPQAFSHIGLINAAWAIGQAEHADADGAEARR